LINYNKPTISILNGFVLQAFNFLWCISPLIYTSFKIDYDKLRYNNDAFMRAKLSEYSNDSKTTLWNINGLITGFIVTYYLHKYFGQLDFFSDILGLILICTINMKFLHYGYNNLTDIMMMLIGPLAFMAYSLYSGTFVSIIKLFLDLHNLESISFLLFILGGINFVIK
jgi:hypothetical protein